MMDLVGVDMALTQEALAAMIGVRRTSLTLAAQNLQDRGLISYVRGRMHVADSEKLKQASCGLPRSS
jgi:Mn-dependent DtxR family transcriptional regulator